MRSNSYMKHLIFDWFLPTKWAFYMVQINTTHKRVDTKESFNESPNANCEPHSGRSPVYICDFGFSTSLAQYWGWIEYLKWLWWWFPEKSLLLILQDRCYPGPASRFALPWCHPVPSSPLSPNSLGAGLNRKYFFQCHPWISNRFCVA